MRGPPDLVVGRRGDRSQLGSGNDAADGGVEVRGAAFLGFDGAEVLHVQPTQRRVFCQNRSTKAGKWIASRAALR